MSFWQNIHAISSSLDETDYYTLLGVKNDSPGALILQRYYHLAAKLHPDKFAQADKNDLIALSKIHARFQEAKRILENPHTRKHYDTLRQEGEFRYSGENQTKSTPGPTHEMAKKCLEEGLKLKRQGNLEAARKQLNMALRYQKDSTIQQALDSLENNESSPLKRASTVPLPSALSSFLGGDDDEDEEEAQEENPPDLKSPQASGTPPPLPSGAKDRLTTRKDTMLPVRINIKNQDQFKVLYTKDISKGGMFLVSDDPKPKGTNIQLTVVAPNGKSVRLLGTVVHIRPEGEGRAAGMGVRFDDTAETQKLVGGLITELESSKPKKTLSLDDLVKTLIEIRDMPPHNILGIPQDSSKQKSEDAYADLIQKYHPLSQKEGDPMIADASQEILAIIRKAYETFIL